LFNLEGESFLDGLSGMWNVYVGHGRQELVDAAASQLKTLAFATAYAGSSNQPAIELATTLQRLVYKNIEAFYFTLGGSDATDTSVRTARFYWGAQGRPEKFKVIARTLSYHGSTIGAAAATGVEESFLANVGDSKSLVVHPATVTHGQLTEAEQRLAGVKPEQIRFSIGTEHVDDLLWDIAQAFERSAG